MSGFITERDFDQAEAEFPGIRELFEACVEKPRTFIDLLARYLGIGERKPELSLSR
jgi:hypothetical protein